jgi:hypothetical protein
MPASVDGFGEVTSLVGASEGTGGEAVGLFMGTFDRQRLASKPCIYEMRENVSKVWCVLVSLSQPPEVDTR